MPRILDLFCGAGGAAMGYHRAGFDVVGVDLHPQKNYPFEFHQADALEVLTIWTERDSEQFNAIHASPPCQHYAPVTRWRGDKEVHPDLLQPTIKILNQTGLPWVVENVPHSPMAPDLVLCGSMFDLKVRRHRWFLTSWGQKQEGLPSCHHEGLLPFMHKGERAYANAMECNWMTVREGRQAIPPAYTEWVGKCLLSQM